MTFQELDGSPAGLDALRRFHAHYEAEFPDADERESLDNMLSYLRSKERLRKTGNNYHILVARAGQELVGGAIFNYFSRPNAGVIEFLFVRSAFRGQGHGAALLKRTEALLRQDARAVQKTLAAVVAEMDDPYRRAPSSGVMDTFSRAVTWGRWGYSKLEFTYVQPALGPGQHAVNCLALIVKPNRAGMKTVSSAWVCEVLHEYMRLAMRIARPTREPSYREMRRELTAARRVALTPLESYVGRDGDRSMHIAAIESANDPAIPQVTSLLQRTVGSEHAASDAHLEEAITTRRRGSRYHLWRVHASATAPLEGLASFFSFDKLGFGGYLVLSGKLQGRGLAQQLLARIEEQMIRDYPGSQGWVIECRAEAAAVFSRLGFRRVPVSYWVPGLSASGSREPEPPRDLSLLFKAFGSPAPHYRVPGEVLRETFANVLRHVYRVPNPPRHACYRHFCASLNVDSSDAVVMRASAPSA